jgi:hypothetical protein
MCRIRVGQHTHGPQYRCNVVVPEELEGCRPGWGIYPKRLSYRHGEEVSPTHDADCCIYRIQNPVRCHSEFSYRKIMFALIKSEPDVYHPDPTFTVGSISQSMGHTAVIAVIELKILTDERERLARPGSRVRTFGNGLESLVTFQTGLGIFCHTGSRKHT